MKVLISAYACEPDKGSEPAVGWHWALEAARSHDVWVLTRSNNRPAIEAALAEGPISSLHFVYHDLPRWARFWKRGGRGLYLYYLLWQLTALRLARRLHACVGFDIGHHLTFVSYRFPSFLAWLGIPYIWGPVAGAERAPASFYPGFGWRATAQQVIRDASNFLLRFDPLVRRTARSAQTVLAATPETAAALSALDGVDSVLAPAIGWAGEVEATPLAPGSLRVIFVGRLVHWKGMHLGLEAFAAALSRRPGITMTIVGDGPQRYRLERLSVKLGTERSVTFTGQVSGQRVLELLKQHNCLLFPSFQDSGGFAILEAMASGLPVVCLRTGGPALLVSGETGIRISPRNPAQLVSDIRDALLRLQDDELLRSSLGAAGARRALDQFAWEQTGELIERLYQLPAASRVELPAITF